jgi:NADH-quinone oxidoreductase subunit E
MAYEPVLIPHVGKQGAFTLVEVECLGACDRAPVVMVNDDWHERLAPEAVGTFIDEIRARGQAAFSGCHLKKEGRST